MYCICLSVKKTMGLEFLYFFTALKQVRLFKIRMTLSYYSFSHSTLSVDFLFRTMVGFTHLRGTKLPPLQVLSRWWEVLNLGVWLIGRGDHYQSGLFGLGCNAVLMRQNIDVMVVLWGPRGVIMWATFKLRGVFCDEMSLFIPLDWKNEPSRHDWIPSV